MGRKDHLQGPDVVLHQLSVSVPCRGADWHHAIGGSVQLAVEQLVFRGGAFPLCSGWRDTPCALWGLLLLVSEGDGPDDERDAGEMAFLALPHWIPPDLRLHACSRAAWHAAKDLYV